MKPRLGTSGFKTTSIIAFIAIISVMSFAVRYSSEDARHTFIEELGWVEAEQLNEADTNAHAMFYWSEADGLPVHAILAVPTGPDTPVPLGALEWPKPGEFFATGDFTTAQIEQLSARFGHYRGAILDSIHVPSAASSRMVLAHPKHEFSLPLRPVCIGCAAGYVDPGFFFDDRIPHVMSYVGLALAIVVPAMILLATYVVMWRRRWDRTCSVLEILGADPRRLHRILFRQLLRPWALAAVASGIVVTCAGVTNIPLPLASFTVRAIDVRRLWWLFGLVWLAGLALTLLIVWFVSRVPRLTRANTTIREAPPTLTSYVLGGIGLGVTVVSSLLAVYVAHIPTEDAFASRQLATVFAGVGLTMVFLPFTVALVLRIFGAVLVKFGRVTARASAIISGRSLRASRPLIAVARSGSILVLLTAVIAIHSILAYIPAMEAQRDIDRIDGAYVQIFVPPEASTEDMQSLEDALRDYGFFYSSVYLTDSGGEISSIRRVFSGDAAALSHWGLIPGTSIEGRDLPDKLNLLVPQMHSIDIEQTKDIPYDAENITPIVFSLDGAPVTTMEVTRLVAGAVGPAWNVYVGGEDQIVGANSLVWQFRWLNWCAMVTSVLLMASMLIASSRAEVEYASHIMPIQHVYGSDRIIKLTLWLRSIATATTIVILGGGSGLLFGRALSDSRLAKVGGLPPIIGALCVMMVVVMAINTFAVTSRSARASTDHIAERTNDHESR